MQWTSPDTVIPDLYQPNDWNRYLYARNNPLKYTDPDGHCPKPATESGNVICIDLFIQTSTIVFGSGYGDNRGFDTNSAPGASRAYLYIYLDDNGMVISTSVVVNQSCTILGCFGPINEYNHFSVNQENPGDDIVITWNLLNGVSGELRNYAEEVYKSESSIGSMSNYSSFILALSYGLASINGQMIISLGEDGKYQITSLNRDPYPSLGVYYYKDGDYQYTLGEFAEKYGPILGLSSIAPNQIIRKK